ncbi:hypothetical protein TRFO_16021 [Tritrichomonas foetus]|uniref:Uncharacterized protein n=1 Tax=Tritrichomonas foetus TaxID=1144522 RepID=A0A1J4KRR9_9EUKA|nr:hypothetical protein TRFO_16021 [Tritrichomonas foetus]|eukprot:OHT13794.1 hypothetical protein TRFO_16021 [Tritrichomonas foetus]
MANKNAAVVAERKMQKEARDKRENEKREAEEKASQKRAEIMEKKAQREAERAKQMKLLQQEAKDRQKKYENLEAPFKKAMGGAVNSTNQQQPKAKSTEKNERPLPKYRNDYADDLDDDYVDQQKTDNKSNKEKPKLPDKQPTIRPDKVRNREEEQKNLREMMAKKRAELRAQKLAEKKDWQVLEEAMLGQNNGNQNSNNQPNPQDVPTSKEVEPNLSIKKQDILVKDQSNSVCVENVNSSSEEQVEVCGVMKRPTRLEDLIHISDSDNEDEDDDILSLVAIVKNILDDPPTSDEDSSEKSDDNDDNSEPSSVIFTFSGKELHLPMVKDNDSLQYRIEALRQFIEKNLGFDKFLEIYRLISVEIDEMNEGEGETKVKEILNDNELSFYPLIQQLVFCEESI